MSSERPRRREVLDALRGSAAPLGVADVAERLGVHPNTARFHLDALVEDGAAERALERPSGPGRPRTVYTARPGMDRGGSRGYRLLAQILLSRLAAAGPAARGEAERAGREWGRYLVDRPPPFGRISADGAAGRLTALLADLDFAPEPGGDVIRLRHCPFLELAEEYGPLVCDVHLGLMRGALAELDAPLQAEALEPFAEPDACLARLRRT
ncbi:helix-turn-helix transcriptional regulator [Actinomadura opuntiae]|uniref:helix-turn-helix transcriptional regulator n=1 Tax=Actinomadura sp. OS1-43 TaxID=604315 RepID=UPI00255B0A53|nr:helix-turn-helix domain-containing protein [Actinomadura sp. OS1-43]MDL4820629.1 helix-turn-helix domain-containing protein [Actinomadura sp. OS1-43]